MRVEFNGLRLDLPEGWADITDDLPPGSPPSLARDTGVGALQFSIARYSGGEAPVITPEGLRDLLEDFCERQNIPLQGIAPCAGRLMCVGLFSTANGEAILAQYLSNGRDVVFATYVSAELSGAEFERDLAEAKAITASIEF